MADTTDRPPRRRRPAAEAKADASPKAPVGESKPPPSTPPGKGPANLEKKLSRMISSFALPFAAAGDMHCAAIFAQRGPVVAEAWANLAAESPAVKEALEAMLKGGAWTGAIGATAGLLLPVAVHHGAPVPASVASLMGIQRPHSHSHTEPDEPIIEYEPPPPPAPSPGTTPAPGPAAVSQVPTGPGDGPDPRDPSAYPGN